MSKKCLSLLVFLLIFLGAEVIQANSSSDVKVELSALGFDDKATRDFLNDFKLRLQKMDYSSDMFPADWDEVLQVKKYQLDSNESEGEVEVLRLSYPLAGDYFFVFFSKRDSGKWKSIGFVRSSSKYEEAVLDSTNYKKHNLISLSECDGGTGIFNSYRDMYLVIDGALKQVLSYQAEGHRNTWDLMYDETYISKPIQFKTDKNGEFLELQVSINYLCGNCGDKNFESKVTKLFTQKYRFDYVWNGNSKQFDLDVKRNKSDKKPSEVIDSMKSNEEFLMRSVDDLRGVANSGDEKQKEWLKCFLENCKPETNDQTNAKNQLLGLLN